jgi:hypothetical protein
VDCAEAAVSQCAEYENEAIEKNVCKYNSI